MLGNRSPGKSVLYNRSESKSLVGNRLPGDVLDNRSLNNSVLGNILSGESELGNLSLGYSSQPIAKQAIAHQTLEPKITYVKHSWAINHLAIKQVIIVWQ